MSERELLHTDRVLVVEGKYDAARLSHLTDAMILLTDGFGIYKDKKRQQLLKTLAKKNGLILFTDSDAAGFRIRTYITGLVGAENVVQAYVPAIHGKEKRKPQPGKEGLLGVEGVDDAIVLQCLRDALGAEAGAAPARPEGRQITYTDLYNWGLSGTPGSAERKYQLLNALGLPPRLSKKELVEALMQEHEAILSTPFVGHEDDLQAMGLRCIDTEIDRRSINPLKDMKLLKTYRKMLDEIQPDLVITYSIKPNIYMGSACKAKGIPYVTNVQGLGTAFEKPVLSSVVSMMYRSALRKAETVFFENEENAQFFLHKTIISAQQMKVLPGAGINLDEYPYVPMKDDGVCSFLFVGRIMKEKGVDEFFAAAKTIKAEFGEKVAFDVVGFYEDAYKETVDQLVADGVIKFHGFQTDVHPFYEAADCVVLPSYHEGMSNVLLEGAATGRALITSDIPGCREAVEDGVSGYLCPAQDAEALTNSFREFAGKTRNEQEQMGCCGRALIERKFDKRIVVAQTIEGLMLPVTART